MAKKKGGGGKKKGGGGKKGPGSLMDLPPKAPAPKYMEGAVIMESLSLIESYFRKSKSPMFEGELDITSASKILYEAEFGVLAYDETEESVCTYANEAAQKLLGADWEGLVGKPVADPTHTSCLAGIVVSAKDLGFEKVDGATVTKADGGLVEEVAAEGWRIDAVHMEGKDEYAEDSTVECLGVAVRLNTWAGKEGDAAEAGEGDAAEAAEAAEEESA